jgi:hypothetical protein
MASTPPSFITNSGNIVSESSDVWKAATGLIDDNVLSNWIGAEGNKTIERGDWTRADWNKTAEKGNWTRVELIHIKEQGV